MKSSHHKISNLALILHHQTEVLTALVHEVTIPFVLLILTFYNTLLLMNLNRSLDTKQFEQNVLHGKELLSDGEASLTKHILTYGFCIHI